MREYADVLARARALEARRAVLVRENIALASDPMPVFGIAPVKLVSEEIVQAIAYGHIGGQPQVTVRWNPLSRESQELEPFAEALDDYVMGALDNGQLPRIWLPHRAALTLVDLLGWRYRTNQQASDRLRRMGWQCRALAEEAAYPDQQVVAIAGDLLIDHVVTGQVPIKDFHLDALLAWLEDLGDADPTEEADRRALVPAAAMLERRHDDRVEHLRKIAKRGGPMSSAARGEVERLLREGALREWDLLTRGRAALWGLGLPTMPGVDALADGSRDRITYALTNDLSPPTNPHSLSRLLDRHENAAEAVEAATVMGDQYVRELARQDGRAVRGQVVRIDQATRNRHPCTIHVRTDQTVLRVRRGTELRMVGGRVDARVAAITEDTTGARVLELSVIKGVYASMLPSIGGVVELVDAVHRDHSFHRNKAYTAMQAAAHPLVYGDALPAPVARTGLPRDLLGASRRLRRS
jgi:hypothetical protein